MEEVKEPSFYIRKQMEKENITPLELADRMGISKQNLNQILNGTRKITNIFAIRLSKAFTDTNAEYWMGLQFRYELLIIGKN